MKDLKQISEEPTNNGNGLIPEDLLVSVSEQDREKLVTIIQETMFSSMTKSTSHLTEKITSEHITNIINNSDSQDKRDRDERKGQRKHNLLIFVISLVFLVFIIVFLKEDKDLLYKLIIAVISFLGGVGIGKSGIIRIN